jgi:hypothetical protein
LVETLKIFLSETTRPKALSKGQHCCQKFGQISIQVNVILKAFVCVQENPCNKMLEIKLYMCFDALCSFLFCFLSNDAAIIKLLTEIFGFYMPVLDATYYGIPSSVRPSTRCTKTQFALTNSHEILTH